jgi:hypothetical protein
VNYKLTWADVNKIQRNEIVKGDLGLMLAMILAKAAFLLYLASGA